ncbi:uncharacterized protein [Dendrobates tinctorius]|uniref:uncharacterized protein n=1 Tax=Dendrobates tinctorius TaxID=92724 RepID=UPI003CC9D35E
MQHKPRICHLQTVNSQKIVKMVRGPIVKAIVSDSSTDITEDLCEIFYLGPEMISGSVQKQEAALLLKHNELKYQIRYTEKNEKSTALELVQIDTIDQSRDCRFIQVSMGDQRYEFQCKDKPELYLCVQGENGGNEVQLRKPGQQHETVFQFYYAENVSRSKIIPEFDDIMEKSHLQRRIHQSFESETNEGVTILEKKTKYAIVNVKGEYRYQTRSSTRKNLPKIQTTYSTFLESVNIIEKKRKCALENPKREYRYHTRSSTRKNSPKIKTTYTTFLESVKIIEKKRKCALENPKREYRYHTRSSARKNSPKIKTTYTTFLEGVNIIEKKRKWALENPKREYRYHTRSSARKNSPKIKTTYTTFLESVKIIEKKRKCALENPKREYRYHTRSSARKNSQKINTRK